MQICRESSIRWLRAHFQVQMTDLNAHDLLVVDECGSNLDLTRR